MAISQYVFKHSKRPDAYVAQLPTIWEDKPFREVYFGPTKFKYPKLNAESFLREKLRELYGERRSSFIITIPQWIKKMHFGCQVNVIDSHAISRGKKYKAFDISWCEFSFDENGNSKSRRRRTKRLYNELNKKEVAHEVSLFVAQKRAETTFSQLHESALNFEYDLDC